MEGAPLPQNVVVYGNNIFNNIDGGLIYNSTSGTPLDATENWWGSPDGPNTPGADTVVGNVKYTPFLTSKAPVCNPNITCPADISVSNDPGQCSASVSFTVSASSNDCGIVRISCSPGGEQTYSPPEQTASFDETESFPVGTTTIVCTATNASGESADCSFTVTVEDLEAPVIQCSDITVDNDPGECSAIVTYHIQVTDNCGIAAITCNGETESYTTSPTFVTFTQTSSFPVGTTSLTCLATDVHGNSAICSFHVIIEAIVGLSVDISDFPAPIRVGEILTYSIVVKNQGVCDVFDLTVVDTLPDDVVVISASAQKDSLNIAGQTLYFLLGTLEPGAQAIIRIRVSPLVSGRIVNHVLIKAVGFEEGYSTRTRVLPSHK